MDAVARLLPRHWDGRRLLRFLTGLALLALAFAAPVAPAVATPAPAAVTTTVESPGAQSAAPVAATSSQRPGSAADRSDECRHDAARTARPAAPVAGAEVLAGTTPGARGSRGPPRA